MKKQRALYEGAVAALSDGDRTTLVLVSRPDHASLDEAARTSDELAEIGVKNQALVVNGVFRAQDVDDEIATAMEISRTTDPTFWGACEYYSGGSNSKIFRHYTS